MSPELSSVLLRDLNRLCNDADDYDVNIQVGEDPNIEDFKAHSAILRIRSSYFNTALSSSWVKKDENIITFKKPNIHPNVFRIILKYLYTGTMAFDLSIVKTNLINLLVAADEMNLEELVDHIQEYMRFDQEWFQRNGVELYNTLSCHQGVFKILDEYFEELIVTNPKRFLNGTNLFSGLESDVLLSLVQNDNFQMDEIEIWNNLLKWAIAKNPTIGSDTSVWSFKEMEVIKQTIHRFIPHIRFFQISSRDYYYKIRPFSTLLPNELEEDLILYFLVPSSEPSTEILAPRKNGSNIIRMVHFFQVTHWINRKQEIVSNFSKGVVVGYDFKLLLRGTRDGFSVGSFRERCYNKGATLVIIKLKGEDKIIGGYNPIDWIGRDDFITTSDSFIFSFQSTLNESTTILSRVKEYPSAIYDGLSDDHSFGTQDLEIFHKVCVCDKYEMKIIKEDGFEMDDYEVFQVIKV